MDDNLLRRIRVAAHSADAPVERLHELLAGFGTDASALVGQDVMVIEKRELAELLAAVARKPSFYDALIADGFRPAVGAEIPLRRGNPRHPGGLERYSAE